MKTKDIKNGESLIGIRPLKEEEFFSLFFSLLKKLSNKEDKGDKNLIQGKNIFLVELNDGRLVTNVFDYDSSNLTCYKIPLLSSKWNNARLFYL